jgi:hypothetical protein
MTTTFTMRSDENPLWLCFEPWGTEHTFAAGTAVVLKFDDLAPVELTHHDVGITFVSLGRHPDIFSENGEPLEIYSDTMPEIPGDLPLEGFRFIMDLMPPIRPQLP